MMDTYDPHKSTVEVRQGNRRMTNFRVLIISGIGIILLFGVVFVVFTMMQPSQI
jgi:hypothetical protein